MAGGEMAVGQAEPGDAAGAGARAFAIEGESVRNLKPGMAAVVVTAASLLMSGPAGADDPDVDVTAIVAEGYGGAALTSPGGVAFDSQRSEILVANTGLHRIDVLGLDGRPLARFPHAVRQPSGELVEGRPRTLAVAPDGRILVIDDLAPYVDVVDYRGRSLGRLDMPAEAGAARNAAPGGVAVESTGTFLVGTQGDSGRVYRFGGDYKLLGSWGTAGSAAGQLSRISCLAAMADGRVVVGCVGTDLAVQIFDAQGRYLNGFGRHDIGPGNFSFPSGIAVTAGGRIWVSDELRQVVQAFDSTGSYFGKVGSGGQGPGEFLYPNSVACLGDTLLAVTERVGNRVQLLRVR
jgi:DNA-binding beta-propeller fold protein YncE